MRWLEEKYPDQDIRHVNTRTNRLKWMLECTLGCSRTFEYRRNELKALLNIPISDEMVTQSFLDSVKPDGVVYKYLRNGKQISFFFQKQTKDGNETSSNLSLGTRLTMLSKRLGRKCCCDTTPERCLKCCRVTIVTLHC